ncbi:MAG: hypothetical protein EZS28_010676 [Streblomastix strix]|uniref:Uncharacterized protein n=1 Tax=Streblomastix strix TaxID=222440 RepID=A0A5J4WHM9_9EUKA|nr:MAG: hypothetical protein EZS28_010676 [Streblomastix strix]
MHIAKNLQTPAALCIIQLGKKTAFEIEHARMEAATRLHILIWRMRDREVFSVVDIPAMAWMIGRICLWNVQK